MPRRVGSLGVLPFSSIVRVHWGALCLCVLSLAVGSACHKPRPRTGPEPAAPVSHSLARADGKPVFAVLPAESDMFPRAAEAMTTQLLEARLKGYEPPALSKVSLEVVQLSIECVDTTPSCYTAVGKELAASKMLFASIEPGKGRQVRISVTLFDVDAQKRKRTTTKVFKNEDAALAGLAKVIAEATK